MKFQFALLAVALAPVVAALKAGSKAGQKLLSKARRLNDEVDFSWVASYSIQFDKCHSLIQVAGEEQAQDGGSMIYTYNLVTFSLCPSDTCGTSSKHTGCAQYVVGMDIFVDMYTETKLEEQEAACEYVRENCNADDDGGENQCYIDAGLEDCIEVEGGEEFEVQRYLECAELEGNDNNNGNYYNNGNNYRYNQYFIGPYCSSDGNSITLAIFYDEGCSAKATETDIYSTLMGTELPFSSESIVKNDCISCKEVDEDEDGNNNNNQNDQDDADELIEFCEQLYESSGKCETNVASTATYADESACNYINTILPRLEANSKSITNGSSTGNATAAKVFAWLFACTTLALGAYAFLLFRKLRRSKTNLADQGSLADHGGMADHGGEMN